MKKRLLSFTAHDEDGNEYLLDVLADTDQPDAPKEILTAEGKSLSRKSKGVYKFPTGMTVTSDDPDAP